jgi:hypothetical protein
LASTCIRGKARSEELRTWALRIAARSGKQLAVVALARRLAGIVCSPTASKWTSLKPDTKKKLLWDNAARFYKHDLDEPDEKLLAFAQSFEDKKGPPRGAQS